MMEEGYQLFSLTSTITVNWTQYNEEALKWVDDWVGEFLLDVDYVTGERISRELANFVSQENYTIGDVISGLEAVGLDPDRAQKIAVTEVTRTFGKSEQVAGKTLADEFPDVRVIKTWYTNNDALVCPICMPLNGRTVLINQEFAMGIEHPPAHVRCRCNMQTRTDIREAVDLYEPTQMEIPF